MGGGKGGSVNDIHITKSSRIYSRESAMDTVTKIMLNITLTSAIVTDSAFLRKAAHSLPWCCLGFSAMWGCILWAL